MMTFERASGILLHPTSLPSRGGIGDLGPAAYQFLDFLSAAKQAFWQVLPLGPVGYGNSPYSSTSAFAGNPLLISLERLAQKGWLDGKLVERLNSDVGPVDYDEVQATKIPLVQQAAQNFIAHAGGAERQRFQQFRDKTSWWLEDYVLFAVLRRHHGNEPWNRWPSEVVRREPQAIDRARQEFAQELEIERAMQFAFFEQWRALHQECQRRGIRVLGDVAIFVNFDSADVWKHSDIFRLNGDLEPEVVAGVPPDAFSETGQRWGNPLYRWDVLQQRGYDWWVRRMRWAVQSCDWVRLDHFRGFESYWEIPAAEPTAVHGRWVKGPADDLFHVLRKELGGLPLVAEDLGMITQQVHELRERLQIPGMKVLQFAFNDPGAHIYLPHRFEENTVVYTGTHDNDTTAGWWRKIDKGVREAAEAYFGPEPEDGMHWAMIRAAETSVARYCIIPLQDLLGLDSDARMNTPSRSQGNWTWRFAADTLKPELAAKAAAMVEISDRIPHWSQTGQQSNREMREDFAA